MAGTLTRKAEPHQKWSSRNPPTIGPITAPPVMPPVQSAIAVLRWPPSWNMLRISARVEGISVAPASPSSARVAISTSAPVEYAATTEATPNAPAPIISSLRRPILSPRDPIVISIPASTNP